MYIGKNPLEQTISDKNPYDFRQELDRILKTVTKIKKFKIEDGGYVNNFTVHFTDEGEAVRVDINTRKKVDPKEERINFLEQRLRTAVQKKQYEEVEEIVKQIRELVNQ